MFQRFCSRAFAPVFLARKTLNVHRYLMVFIFPTLFFGWKILKKSKWVKSNEADLVTDLAEIEEYHRLYVEKPETNPFHRALDRLFG